jgi:hypothetical protein
MESAAVTTALVDVIATLVGTTLVTHAVLRVTCAGPAAPRALLSMTCGIVAAGVVAFAMLIR